VDLGFDQALDQARLYSPSFLVCDAFDFVGPLVATALDRPWASFQVSAGLPGPLSVALRDRSAAQHAVRGLRPRERLAIIDQLPDLLRVADDPPAPADRIAIRPAAHREEPAAGAEPSAPDLAAARPLVLISTGTSMQDLGLLAELLASVTDAGYRVAVPAEPGTLAEDPRVRAVGFVPLDRLLPMVDAVVSTGGMGTVLAILAHALPCVLRPVLADQP
jgi:UDP:flavonoid glycosyltransferase YjiC (YdhE family)